jgi:hypothetical protein
MNETQVYSNKDNGFYTIYEGGIHDIEYGSMLNCVLLSHLPLEISQRFVRIMRIKQAISKFKIDAWLAQYTRIVGCYGQVSLNKNYSCWNTNN